MNPPELKYSQTFSRSPESTQVSERDKDTLRPPAFLCADRPSGIHAVERRNHSDAPIALSSIPVRLPDGSVALPWELLRQGPRGRGVAERLALKALVEVCGALSIAHEDESKPRARRVFGATSPANVVFSKSGQAHLPTDVLSILPQPRLYVAPERERGNPPDQSSDIYAVGVMLLEVLAGRDLSPEEAGELQPKSIQAHPLWRDRLGDPLLAVALRATSLEPAYRWGSVEDLAIAIGRRGGGRVARREELVALIAMTLSRYAAKMTRLSQLPVPREAAAFDLLDLPGIEAGAPVDPWDDANKRVG